MKKSIIVSVLLVIVAVVVLFGLIQLIPYGKSHTNPPVKAEPPWDSPQTRALAVRACFDCHSNETQWPWYTNIAPSSWLTQRDVDEGRRRLNFSEWTSGAVNRRGGREGGDMSETITRGSMPPWFYTPLHPLTDAEKQELITGLAASLK